MLSFTELRTYTTLKTVAIMDELENLVTLNEDHVRLLRGKRFRQGENVLIAGGRKGVLHGYYFSMSGIQRDSFELNSLFSIQISKSSNEGDESSRILRLNYVQSSSTLLVANADHVIYLYEM